MAANEIAITLSLAAHLIRDPGIARVRLAAAIIEDIADLLATERCRNDASGPGAPHADRGRGREAAPARRTGCVDRDATGCGPIHRYEPSGTCAVTRRKRRRRRSPRSRRDGCIRSSPSPTAEAIVDAGDASTARGSRWPSRSPISTTCFRIAGSTHFERELPRRAELRSVFHAPPGGSPRPAGAGRTPARGTRSRPDRPDPPGRRCRDDSNHRHRCVLQGAGRGSARPALTPPPPSVALRGGPTSENRRSRPVSMFGRTACGIEPLTREVVAIAAAGSRPEMRGKDRT